MKELSHFLSEGISAVLYHFTGFDSLLKILKDNEFRLTTSIGTPSEVKLQQKYSKDKKFFYLSTTRNKTGGYTLVSAGNFGAVINLDGRKLSNNYSGSALDYWGPDFRKGNPYRFEMEDRIFHDKPTIPSAKKYIDEIHFHVIQLNQRSKRTLRKILIELKKSNISYWMYDDGNAFVTQNKKKAISLNDVNLVSKEKDKRYNFYTEELQPWLELWYTPVDQYEKLRDDAKRLLRNKIRHDLFNQANTSLQASIHSERKERNKNTREIEHLVRIMQKNNFKTVHEFVDSLKKKWEYTDK